MNKADAYAINLRCISGFNNIDILTTIIYNMSELNDFQKEAYKNSVIKCEGVLQKWYSVIKGDAAASINIVDSYNDTVSMFIKILSGRFADVDGRVSTNSFIDDIRTANMYAEFFYTILNINRCYSDMSADQFLITIDEINTLVSGFIDLGFIDNTYMTLIISKLVDRFQIKL